MLKFLILYFLAICLSQEEKTAELINKDGRIVDNSRITPKFAKSGLKNVFLVNHKVSTKAVVEENYSDKEGSSIKLKYKYELHRKQVTTFTSADKKELLKLHNVYRMNVTPPAADMEWMQWDEQLAEMAQAWADNCVFRHGLPDHPKHYTKVGQNLYMGTYSETSLPLYLWYEEFKDYNFYKKYCPSNKQCGHYTAMVWATSNRVGCARKAGCPRNQYYVVCHYYPPGNMRGEYAYKVGTPCSKCKSNDGGLCYKNICVTKSDCQRESLACSCKLKCYNGGLIDKNKCKCICKDGWEGLDCSEVCRDEHHYCNKNPGFPDKSSCSSNEGRVATIYCRKMCGQCKGVGKDLSNTYCKGKLCSFGYVLDNNCNCKVLCPGIKCHSGSSYFQQNALVLIAITLFGLNI